MENSELKLENFLGRNIQYQFYIDNIEYAIFGKLIKDIRGNFQISTVIQIEGISLPPLGISLVVDDSKIQFLHVDDSRIVICNNNYIVTKHLNVNDVLQNDS